MRVGFSGTRDGMTDDQRRELLHWLSCNKPIEAHHGCCVGADDEFHRLMMWARVPIILHPPKNAKLTVVQHFMDVPGDHVCPDLPYLDRNKAIADAVDWMVFAPKTEVEVKRSGTWATIRYFKRTAKGRGFLLMKP